jgi:hypothetical protein
MSFFVIVKGCVNFHEMTPLHKKNAYSNAEFLGVFSENDRIAFKFNSSLFFYLTNLVSVSYPPVHMVDLK